MKMCAVALKILAAVILAAAISPQCFAQDRGASEGIPEISGVQLTPRFVNNMNLDIGLYLFSAKPDLSKLDGVFKILSRADLNNPAVQKALAPVAQDVQSFAAHLIYRAGPQLAHGPSPAAAEAEAEKFSVLEQKLSPYLSPTQRREIQPLAARYRGLINADARARLDARLEKMAAALGTLRDEAIGGGPAVNADAEDGQLEGISAPGGKEQLAELSKPTDAARVSAPTLVPKPPTPARNGGRKIESINGYTVISDAHGTELRRLHGVEGPIDLAWLSPDGSRAITVSYDRSRQSSLGVIWEVDADRKWLLPRIPGHVSSTLWSADGNWAVAVNDSGIAVILNVKIGRELNRFRPSGQVRSIWLSPDESQVLVLTNKETIVPFNVKTGEELKHIPQLMTVK